VYIAAVATVVTIASRFISQVLVNSENQSDKQTSLDIKPFFQKEKASLV